MLSKALASASASAPKVYVEDVFSTWLYTGNGSTQTITNGIDLSGKGGLVWLKGRSGATGHRFVDTARGATKSLDSSSASPAAAEATESTGLTSFSSTGFSIGADTDYNTNAATYVSWAFRKAAKFFDVVTYTGTGANRTIAHSLGSVPGCIMVKRTDTTGDWQVYHRSLANTEYLVLNTTAAKATGATRWNSTTPTSTVFSLGTDATVNANGGTYVAYLFAHDAGGFGDNGTDNIISCGSYTGNGAYPSSLINLGWEPQWVCVRKASNIDNLNIFDAARAMSAASYAVVYANIANAETFSSASSAVFPKPTGFTLEGSALNASGETYIYIAIRRGPMKTPTDATKVFNAVARTGTGANATVTCGFQADAFFVDNRVNATIDTLLIPRLTGANALFTTSTTIEAAQGTTVVQANPWDVMDGIKLGTTSYQTNSNAAPNTFINYFFKRAPGFFDVVMYAGDGVAGRSVTHNLGAKPQMIWIKLRNGSSASWMIHTDLIDGSLDFLQFDNTAKQDLAQSVPTSTLFYVSSGLNVVNSNYIAYLFGNVSGVSKVGAYTGTGTTLDINCGFTNGARFVLIKRTDTTGDWYYWDTARGIVAGNDPYLLLNSVTTSEVTNTDYIDPLSSGFQISSTAPADINASGGTYLYLAIA